MATPLTPFPTLFTESPERWQWPSPPFTWRHLPAPGNDTVQPCRIESVGGSVVEGELLDFNPDERTVSFRTTGPVAVLAFSRFVRLTLTAPLRPVRPIDGAPVERVPTAVQERDYRLQASNPATVLTGRTAGHVETADGLYLFAPTDDGASVQRVFVPRTAYTRFEFGLSTEEIAASRWVASPRELLDAIERQNRMPVRPLGHALLDLGLLTQAQLDRALTRLKGDRPLGETLVSEGLISRADLKTALAHKMGYPLVDLSRFPIDPEALAKLPVRLATGYRAMPLLLNGTRLIVAVDNPSRVAKLNSVQAFAQVQVVAALAPKAQIILAIGRLSNDVWQSSVPQRVPFFATTV